MSERFNLNKFISKQFDANKNEADAAINKAVEERNDKGEMKLKFDNEYLQKQYYDENFPPDYKEVPGEENDLLDEEPDLDITSKDDFTEEDARKIIEKMNDADREKYNSFYEPLLQKKKELFILQKLFKKKFGNNMKNPPDEEVVRIHDAIDKLLQEVVELKSKSDNFLNREELN